jgi:ATP sulfurylase
MDARRESEPMKNRTTVERKSERELVVTRTFNGPHRVRGVDQARAVQAVVVAEVDGHVPAFL